MNNNAIVRRALCVLILLVGICGDLWAQTRVRVIKDGAIIWRVEFSTPLTTVTAGTILEVIGRKDQFFIVRLSQAAERPGQSGLIAMSQVDVLSPANPSSPIPPSQPFPSPVPPTSSQVRTSPVEPDRSARRQTKFFGFGQLGYTQWAARNTFEAVLGTSKATTFGGGIRMHFSRLLVDGSLDWFERTGSRVFIDDGTVFDLGIADTVRIIPLSATVAYRRAGRSVSPYVGGGLGMYLYREHSDFADPSEDLAERTRSYHAVAGVEFAGTGWIRTAVEVQFATVPSGMGTTGVSAAFNETNLGAVQGRVKLLLGR